MTDETPPPPSTQARMEEALADLAEEIVNKAQGDEVSVDNKVKAFNAIRVYYAMLMKLKPEDDEGDGFGKWAKERDEAETAGA